jgi:glycosyltransferase involved in cell wall biosynthesis
MMGAVRPIQAAGDREGLSVVIIARNEAPRIGSCLDSATFADEVIVVDALSEDGTAELCRRKGARVFERPWTGYGDQKNFAMAQAREPWIMILDADERVPEALCEEIEEVLRAGNEARAVAYRIPRRNYFYGRWVRHGGLFPDYQVRLLRCGVGRYNDVGLHENLLVEGPIGTLRHCLDHMTEPAVADHFRRLDRYATLGSRETGRRKRRVRWIDLTLRPAVTLFKMYVFKQGFRDGIPGFLVCAFAAMHTFLKYAKVWETQLGPPAPRKP